jgi:hypothetical protein
LLLFVLEAIFAFARDLITDIVGVREAESAAGSES